MTKDVFGFDWDGCLGGHTTEKKAQDVNWIIKRHKNLWAWIQQILGDSEGIYIDASARCCFQSEKANFEDRGASFPIIPQLESALENQLQIRLKFSPYLCTDHYYVDERSNYIANPTAESVGQTFNAIKTATQNFTVSYNKVRSISNPILNNSSYTDKSKILMVLMQMHYLHSLRATPDAPLTYHFLDDMYAKNVFDVLSQFPQLIPPGMILDCVLYDADFKENETEFFIQKHKGFQTISIGQIKGTATEEDLQNWPARIKILMKLTDRKLGSRDLMTPKIFTELLTETDELLKKQMQEDIAATPKTHSPPKSIYDELRKQQQQQQATEMLNLNVETDTYTGGEPWLLIN